jgi:hypothetical protein
MPPEVLQRVRGALLIDRVAPNTKETIRDFVRSGPIKGLVNGSERIWNTTAQRVDNAVGTKLAGGGPI